LFQNHWGGQHQNGGGHVGAQQEGGLNNGKKKY